MQKRGRLIVIEGTDGSGKETQAKALHQNLTSKGISSEVISFPRYGTATGDIIGECYLGKNLRFGGGSWFRSPLTLDPLVASLYYAADRRDSSSLIKHLLSQGVNVILDRYYQSNMGHQGGKLKTSKERIELWDKLEKLELGILEIPKEDVTIFLYMPWEITRELRRNRQETKDAHETSQEHLINAEQAYLELVERYNWTKINCQIEGKIAPRDRQEISEEVLKEALKIIQK